MIGAILKGMMKSGMDTAEIASFVNRHPDLLPEMQGQPIKYGKLAGSYYPIREGDVWNAIAAVDHLDLVEDAA